MYQLKGMIFKIKLDRGWNPDIHYISPGGYKIKKDGKIFQFDFLETIGNGEPSDDKSIIFFVQDFDEEYAKETNFNGEFKDPKELLEYCFEDFFVFTGEDDDAEINVVELSSLTFRLLDTESFDDAFIDASKEQIKQINQLLKN